MRKDLIEAALGMPFLKVTGGGNDFVLLDNRNGRLEGDLSELVRRIAHRGLGVGADGVILAEWSAKADLKMVYHNADGGRADLCGNGLRCFTRWAVERASFPSPLRIETGAGVLRVGQDSGTPWFRLPLGSRAVQSVKLELEGRVVEGVRVDVGVPHLVIETDDLAAREFANDAPRLRAHPDLGPDGANVDFFVKAVDGMLEARYYERGVEAETYSSGTGTIAVALAARFLGRSGSDVRCRNTLGLESRVRLSGGPPGGEATLEGEVRFPFRGRLQREALEGSFPGLPAVQSSLEAP